MRPSVRFIGPLCLVVLGACASKGAFMDPPKGVGWSVRTSGTRAETHKAYRETRYVGTHMYTATVEERRVYDATTHNRPSGLPSPSLRPGETVPVATGSEP